MSIQPAGMHTQASVVDAPYQSSGEGCLYYSDPCISSFFLQAKNTKAELSWKLKKRDYVRQVRSGVDGELAEFRTYFKRSRFIEGSQSFYVA